MALAAPVLTYGRDAGNDPDRLVREHLPLVRRLAWHVHGRVANAIDVEDLIQTGMVALIEAARGYEDRGHAFATYATLRIKGAMIDSLRRHAATARGAMARRRALIEARDTLEQTLGRAAGDAELARHMGLDEAEWRAMADAAQGIRHESIDDLYSDHSMWFADQAEAADDALERGQLRDALARHIARLPQREAMVLQLYFVEELNLDEIGRTLGVGAARVCQIKKAALAQLREALAES